MIEAVSASITSYAPWLLTVMVVWVVFYFVVLRFLNIGVKRIPKSVRLSDAGCMPISVIVSARNEQREDRRFNRSSVASTRTIAR